MVVFVYVYMRDIHARRTCVRFILQIIKDICSVEALVVSEDGRPDGGHVLCERERVPVSGVYHTERGHPSELSLQLTAI